MLQQGTRAHIVIIIGTHYANNIAAGQTELAMWSPVRPEDKQVTTGKFRVSEQYAL
jgi:hypothetical protein